MTTISISNPISNGVLATEWDMRGAMHRMFILTSAGVCWTSLFERCDIRQPITTDPLPLDEAEYWLERMDTPEIASALRTQIERAQQPSTSTGWVFPRMPEGWGQ